MITYTIKVGNGTMTFEAQSVKDVHKFSAIYSNLPKVCDNCKSVDLFLNHRGTKDGDDYFFICGPVLPKCLKV